MSHNSNFQIDEIVCTQWVPVLDTELDGSMVVDNGQDIITTDGDLLWVGVRSNNEETRGIASIGFQGFETFNLDAIEGAFFTLYEGDEYGVGPQFLELDLLPYASPLEFSCYDSPGLSSPLAPTISPLGPVDDNFANVYWDVTSAILSMIANGDPGVTFRIRGTDLTYDGNANFRTFWASDGLPQSPAYTPSLRFCFWFYEL